MFSRLLLLSIFVHCLSSAPGSELESNGERIRNLDPRLLDPVFFSGLKELPDYEILLRGIGALYPGTIISEPPEDPELNHRPPGVKRLKRGITYIRVYGLQADLTPIIEYLSKPAVVLDLRNIHSDLEGTISFGHLLSANETKKLQLLGTFKDKTELDLDPAEKAEANDETRPFPLIILVNRGTKGPLEALLDGIQALDEFILIGASTAGQTAVYSKLDNTPYYIISGEIRPPSGESLLNIGLQPEIDVSTNPLQDTRAYYAYEKGVDIETLVDFHLREEEGISQRPGDPNGANSTGGAGQAAPASINRLSDPILQEAINIIVALQVLRRMPSF